MNLRESVSNAGARTVVHGSPELSFALRLAGAAEEEILARFGSARVSTKEDGSEVTVADRCAEATMRALIRETYPSHGVLGEEEGQTRGTENYQWVLDPIDGTACYSLGIPKFGTLVALLEGPVPRLGVVHLPFTAETLYAERAKGCWYVRRGQKPKRVHVDTTVARLDAAYVSLSGLEHSEIAAAKWPQRFRLGPLICAANRVEFIGDCIQHMLVARGRLHAALDAVMHPWDSAAIVPCIQEAGGVVSTMDGRTDDIAFGGSLLSSCSLPLHNRILELLNA